MISAILGWFVSHSLEPNRNQRETDLYAQEEIQFKKIGIDLMSTADPTKAVISDVETSFGTTKLIRWGNRNKKIVIFVHGIQTDKFTSSKTVKYWNKHNYDVVSYDGFGWGEWRDVTRTRYGSNTEAKLLDEIIQYTKKTYGVEKVILHGESMGGGTVYRFIERNGTNDVERVLIDAGYLSFEKNLRLHAFLKLPKPLYYWGKLTLWFWLLMKRFPVRRQISSSTLKELDIPLMHIQSKEDTLVMHKYISTEKHKFINNSHYVEYKDVPVRHVRGYYDAPEQLEEFIIELLGY